MKYLLLKKQAATGCRHGIGCGMIWEAKATPLTDIEDLIAEIEQEISYPDGEDEYFALEGEEDLSEVLVVPFENAHKLDLSKLRAIHKSRKEYEAEEAERAEFERLKEKYGEK